MHIRLTSGAESDLQSIYNQRLRLRGHDGPDGAEALLQSLIAAMEYLTDFPQRGPIPPELECLGVSEWRQLSSWPYRIIYRLDADILTVAIVADGRRDFAELLERRLLRSSKFQYDLT